MKWIMILFFTVHSTWGIEAKALDQRTLWTPAFRAQFLSATLQSYSTLEKSFEFAESEWNPDDLSLVKNLIKKNHIDITSKIVKTNVLGNKVLLGGSEYVEFFQDGRISVSGRYLKDPRKSVGFIKELFKERGYKVQVSPLDLWIPQAQAMGYLVGVLIALILLGGGLVYGGAISNLGLNADCKTDRQMIFRLQKRPEVSQCVLKFNNKGGMIGIQDTISGDLISADAMDSDIIRYYQKIFEACRNIMAKNLDAKEISRLDPKFFPKLKNRVEATGRPVLK